MATGLVGGLGWKSGPTVFAIGWIPRLFYYGFRPIPKGFSSHPNWLTWTGMFATGNPPPPVRFAGPVDLERFVARRNYRAILGYRDVRVRPPQAGENQHIGEGKLIRVVGFTPVGPGIYSSGEGAAIASRTSGVGLTFYDRGDDLEFRVGEFMNRMHKKATKHLLPYASINVQYNFDYDGSYMVDVSSTNIPNVTVYVDWVAVAEYSMRGISPSQVNDFLTAFSREQPAKVGDRFFIEGNLGQSPTIRPGGVEPGF